MAHSGKTITFATDLLPHENNVYSLGSTSAKWKAIDASNFNGKLLATHVSGGSEEIQIKYSTTIDYWWGVGTANENHGLYDNKVKKWILSAGTANTWTFVGDVTGNAETATKATGDADGNTINTTYAKLSSAAFTGAVTVQAPTENANPATKKYVDDQITAGFAANDAMVFKGVLNKDATATATVLKNVPASGYSAGWTYRVAKEGTYAGVACEVGDMVIAVTDAATNQTAVNNAHWNVIQVNIDGAVVSSSTSSTNNAIARFDGESGRIIQNSGVTIDDDDNIILTAGSTAITNTNNKRLSWKLSDGTMKGYFTISSEGKVGIHGCQELYFRPGDTNNAISTETGTVLTNSAFYPYANAGLTLGISNGRWSNTYINGTIYIGNSNYTAWNSATNGSWLTTGEMGIQRTSAGGGFYLESNGQLAARMWLQTLGTASTAESASGADDGTQGALGEAYLALGNAISRGAKNTTAGANNSQGYLRLYGSDTRYTDVTAMTTSSVSRLYPINGIALPNNMVGILFRPDSSSYHVHISHQTNGNEALVAATQNAVTSFIFINGEKLADISNSRWQHLTPALQIKNNSVYIGELIPHNTTPSYKFKVNGISYFTDIVNIIGDTNAQIGKGINFSLNDIQYGHIGTNNSGMLGIYGNQSVAIRPSLTATNRGIKIEADAITPGESNKIDLGTSTLIWKNVYATTFTGDLIGNATAVKQYYTTNSTDAPLQVRSNNKNVYIWQAGHATSESGGFSNNYALQYYGEGSSPNNYLILKASNSSTVTDAVQVDENGNITVAKTITGTITSSTWTTLLKPINTATTASASTWSIPSGSYQVWGERFSDTRLKYTPSGGSESTVTDTGDWTMWLTSGGTSNTATLNMRIDGTYYGSFSGNLSGNASSATSASYLAVTQLTNQNLNDYTSANPRWYYAVGGNTVTNKPTGVNAFGLYVYRNADSHRAQELYDSNGNKWMRHLAGSSWTAWEKVLTSANYDDYALPLNGGIMSGTITLANTGLKTPQAAGFTTDQCGNFKHQQATASDTWQLLSNAGAANFKYAWETGALTLAGGITAGGQILTSFKSSVAMGSYGSAQTTIPNLLQEVRYSSGCAGSFNLTTAYTLNNVTLATGWYNFIWVPHRSGGVNGAASGDNCDYGALYLHRMNATGYADYILAYSSGAAKLLDLHASFQSTITDGQIIVADGTAGHIKTSGYTTSSFAASDHNHDGIYAPAVTGGYLPKSGGTMTGALNFANNTWNKIGDDAYLGDINKAGHVGIQGINGNTGIFFTTYNQTAKLTGASLSWDGTHFIFDTTVKMPTITITNTSAANHIDFSRTGGHYAPNYINVPTSSALAVSVGGAAGANIAVMVENKSINSYVDAETSLGTSTYEWKETYSKNYVVGKKVKLEYNSTDDSLDFIFI